MTFPLQRKVPATAPRRTYPAVVLVPRRIRLISQLAEAELPSHVLLSECLFTSDLYLDIIPALLDKYT
jgi:hypothetical protein